MAYYNDATELIGRTPLVKINRLYGASQATVLAKLEYYNPANSVKDRIGVAIIDAAEADGSLQPGGTIVEGTSGNTGIALAWLSNWRARIAPGVLAAISAARALAPGTPSAAGVRTSSAPSARSTARRSLEKLSGSVMITL